MSKKVKQKIHFGIFNDLFYFIVLMCFNFEVFVWMQKYLIKIILSVRNLRDKFLIPLEVRANRRYMKIKLYNNVYWPWRWFPRELKTYLIFLALKIILIKYFCIQTKTFQNKSSNLPTYIFLLFYLFLHTHTYIYIYIFFFFFFIIQHVKAHAILCPHQPPTRGDNTVSVAQGGNATPGATKQLLPPDRVFKRNIYLYIHQIN